MTKLNALSPLCLPPLFLLPPFPPFFLLPLFLATLSVLFQGLRICLPLCLLNCLYWYVLGARIFGEHRVC